MTEEFLDKLWLLIKFRYRLVWAQVRTRNGRTALLLATYLLGASAGVVFLLTGISGALAADIFTKDGFFARWILSGFFINGLGLSLLFGVGVRETFAEDSLRRYPLDARERFAVRQVIGLLDPIWLLLGLGVIGMVLGFAWFRHAVLAPGLAAALLFICANYLTTSLLLLIVGLMMRTRRGSAVLAALALALTLLVSVAVSVTTVSERGWFWRPLDWVMAFTPPGAAAAIMVGESAPWMAANGLLLLAWCVAMAMALKRLESRPAIVETALASHPIWDEFPERAARLFGPVHAPLVSKSLRYHLRCNMIRFSLITSPLFVLFGKYMVPNRSPSGEVIVTFAMFFMTSAATGAAMMLNLFGFDDAGIRRYAVMPTTFAAALRAGSFASLTLRSVVMLAAFALWAISVRSYFSIRLALLVIGAITASLFFFNALGLWTSVLAAKRSDLDSMWNNRLSFGSNVVMLGGMVGPYVLAVAFSEHISPAAAARFWWVPALLLLACFAFYVFSLRAIELVLEMRKERLINLIAGATDS
jgi:hypothetical protein